MSSAAASPVMVERVAPSRPLCLGTRRRKPRQAVSAVPEAGATRPRAARPTSLDTEKQLATSVREWRLSQVTNLDKQQDRERLHRRLLATVYEIWQSWARAEKDDGERVWWESYEEQKANLRADANSDYDSWLAAYVKKHGLPTCPETYLHGIYLQEWLRKNRPQGRNREILKWERQYFQLYHCQGEWIGYRAACCEDRTHPMAVPIGCNHRLCPLCAWHRSEKARRKTKKMFDRLTHPVLITLTVPNKTSIRKHDFSLFRKRLRQFVAQNKRWILGGVYSLETTYNRAEKTWHLHAHVLADVTAPLPPKMEKTMLAGRRVCLFTEIKRRLEFDWLRLWTERWGKKPGAKASKEQFAGAEFTFQEWVRESDQNVLKEWRPSGWTAIPLPAAEIARRTQWNADNRRVIDLKPVVDRDKAALEVLKYITKCADFCHLPDAVEGFVNAAKGARLIQTFGTWYGVALGGPCDHEDPDDWNHLKCACGVNLWQRIGLFYRHDVRMNVDGRWLLNRAFDFRSPGTVARPTIRALEGREEVFPYGFNSNDGGSTGAEFDAR